MEVDLICIDKRIAIEIDGMQHLSSKEAYRTDRQKDLLLQEHGYIVLRFLAEDISKRLDVVLDTIFRAYFGRDEQLFRFHSNTDSGFVRTGISVLLGRLYQAHWYYRLGLFCL